MNDFINEPSSPDFGGDWSEQKLSALSKYLSSYTTALKNQKFSLVYIDAFAGSGKRNIVTDTMENHGLSLTEKEEKKYRHGSPLVALETTPSFDKFVFIDKSKKALNNLQKQVEERNHVKKSIDYLVGDANVKLKKICRDIDWKSHRAVAFVDPFSTEVKWDTIKTIASTEAIDLWLLFPAMAVNRMLPRTGKIPGEWQEKLTACFGTNEWLEVFYKASNQATIFEDDSSVEKVPKPFESLNKFVNSRLKTVFPGVSNQNLILRNSRNSPLFLLCFACSNPNPKAYGLALKIAGHIIGTSR